MQCQLDAEMVVSLSETKRHNCPFQPSTQTNSLLTSDKKGCLQMKWWHCLEPILLVSHTVPPSPTACTLSMPPFLKIPPWIPDMLRPWNPNVHQGAITQCLWTHPLLTVWTTDTTQSSRTTVVCSPRIRLCSAAPQPGRWYSPMLNIPLSGLASLLRQWSIWVPLMSSPAHRARSGPVVPSLIDSAHPYVLHSPNFNSMVHTSLRISVSPFFPFFSFISLPLLHSFNSFSMS